MNDLVLKDLNLIEDKKSDISEESDEISDNSNSPNWNTKYEDEYAFMKDLLKKGYIYNPSICPVCAIEFFWVKNYTKQNLCKILYIRRNYIKCRKAINIKNYSIFQIAKSFPCSIIFKIIKKFLFEEKNSKKITELISLKYKHNVNAKIIEKILRFIINIIYIHLKNKYETTIIGGYKYELSQKIVALDEALLIYNSEYEQVWILGGIETKFR